MERLQHYLKVFLITTENNAKESVFSMVDFQNKLKNNGFFDQKVARIFRCATFIFF